MARTATKERNGRNAYGDDSIAGYFRKVFQENPKLLKGRSNDKLLERWLEDHQAYKEVPSDVKSSLANIKSVLRHKKRKRRPGPHPHLRMNETTPFRRPVSCPFNSLLG